MWDDWPLSATKEMAERIKRMSKGWGGRGFRG